MKRSGPDRRAHGIPGWLRVLLIPLALLPCGVEAQSASSFNEVGRFYVRNFAPQEYGSHAQNWAVAQGRDGLLYFGNGSGVLEYDGVSWRQTRTANRSVVRSLAVDADGRVFVGGRNELGYLTADSVGQRSYVSLVDHIADEDRRFADVWSIEETTEGLYFRTYKRLFRWDGQQMKTWRHEARLLSTFVLRDTLYVQQEGLGLMSMDGDSLNLVPGGAFFRDNRIFGVVPQGESSVLGVILEEGRYRLFRCATRPAGAACSPFSPGLTDLLTALQPYHATRLAENVLALGARRGGVVLIDDAGRLLRVLNEASGLRDESVKYTYVDRQGGLWLALDNGLARVEATAPLSYYDKITGLRGGVTDVARHRGRLYLSTTQGVYVLEPATEGAVPRFSPENSQQCWSLLSTPQGLLAGCEKGLYNLDDHRLIRSFGRQIFEVVRSRRDETLFYLGLKDGLARMRLRAGQWTEGERIEGFEGEARGLVEDARGRFWIATRSDGIVRFEAAASAAGEAAFRRFAEAHGLPGGRRIYPMTIAGKVRFRPYGRSAMFEIAGGTAPAGSQPDGDPRFVPHSGFGTTLPEEAIKLVEDEQGQVWIYAGEASGVAQPAAEGGYRFAPTALRRVPDWPASCMYIDAGGPLWVGGADGLLRLDTDHVLDPSTDYPAWIRRVITSDGSVLYDGRRLPGDGHEPSGAGPAIEVPYRDNALRFAFAAPRYDAPEHTVYRTHLEGLSWAATGDGWSAWSTETDKDYTNLWEGRYVFRVQARDVYGLLSREDSFAFRILPPWYRAWWAYTLYALALGAAVQGYVRYHRRQLERERAVSARLREVDRLKDEFLANTSHELRTPLYGITGLAESLIDGVRGELPGPAKADLAMLAASGRRLSQLVNDILDYSRLTHKSLTLRRRPVDLRPLAEVVLTLQRPLAAGKELTLRNAVPPDLPAAQADEARLEQILHNLVGNAVKFTEEGRVEISAAVEEEDPAAGGPAEHLVVTVEDTGIGIAQDHRERIFEAFEQADSGVQRAFGGTGLGLTVTRALVELHDGRIWVESTVGEGTRFSFTLPISGQEVGLDPTEPASSARLSVSRLMTVEPSAPAPQIDERTARPAAPTAGGPAARGLASARVLVVDDEPVILQVLSNHLASEGYEVALASSGSEALVRLEQQPFDLVVLDVMMPRTSGYEVCRALRERHSLEELPVIFLTAKNQAPDLVAGLEAGGNDYLAKPIGRDELLARVRTHLELLAVHRRLAAKNDELARFNYTIAHDLKNPLTTIMNFAGLARLDAAAGRTERLDRDLSRLDAAARKLRRLLGELFELSRVGVQLNPLEKMAFGELVHDALAQLLRRIVERGIEIEMAPDLPVVTGDRVRLAEAVRHLLGNAVQYMGDQPGPRIEVGVRGADLKDSEPPTFYIRDNGMGIDPRYHDRVFDLFERLEPEASEGTGIGLALVRRIVEVHGGRIWVESEGTGRGSTFCFTLPLAER